MYETTPQVYTINTTDGRTIKYKHIKSIGKGAKGQVYLIEGIQGFVNNQKGLFALKKITADDEEEVELLEKEAALLQKINHVNVVKYIDCFRKKSKRGVYSVNIVTEYCDFGNLESLLSICVQTMNYQSLQHQNVIQWIKELASAICYLHSQNIVHRDIKASNILFKKDGKRLILVLCDFGFSRLVEMTLASTVVGTKSYLAPEILRKKKYHTEVDIWSMGVVIFQILMGVTEKLLPPVDEKIGQNPNYVKETLKNVRNEFKPLAELCFQCLQLDPVQRPTAQEVVDFLNGKRKLVVHTSPLQNIGDKVKWHIRNFRGRKFWEENWKQQQQVEWIDFYDAYKDFLDDHKKNEGGNISVILTESQQRGLKKLVSVQKDSQTCIVTAFSFDAAINKAGFPFDASILAGIDRYQVDGGELVPNFDKGQYYKAREIYLQQILKYDRLFVDPASNNVLDIDKHCVTLELLLYDKWRGMLDETEWDTNDNSPRNTLDNKNTNTKENKPNGNFSGRKIMKDALKFLVRQKNPRFFVLGPSACGKTCLMKGLLKSLSQIALNNKNAPVPILIPVSALTKSKDDASSTVTKCLKASAAGLNYSNDIFAFLQFSVLQKNVILLFDGLDEAGMWRPAVESYVMEMHRSQVNGIIVTSRLSRYDADETIRNPFFDFSLAKILPLSANMQIEIAHKRGVNDAKFTQLLKEEKYRELCQSPFLLSMMIEYFKRNKKTIAPVQADVFAKAMDTLIEKYITNKSFTMRTALPESESLFRFLIWLGKLLHENRLVEFSKEYIEERVKMSEELKAQWNFLVNDIEEGLFPILVMHRKDFYRFSHLSFQEFFVARAWANPEILSIIRKEPRGTVVSFIPLNLIAMRSKHVSLELDKKKIGTLIIDPWYRETFFLCAGLLNDKDFSQLVDILLDIYPSFAMIKKLLWKMVRERPLEKQKQLEERIKKENFFKTLIKGLGSSNKELREMAKEQFMSRASDAADYLDDLIDLLHSYDAEVQKSVIWVLKKLTKCGVRVPIPVLLNLARTSCNDAIMQCLLLLTPDDEKQYVATEVMKMISQNSWGFCENVRMLAVSLVLVHSKKGDKNIISECMSILASLSSNTKVRYCAFRILREITEVGDDRVITQCIHFMKFGRNHHDIEESARILMKISEKGNHIVLSSMLGIVMRHNDEFVRIQAANVLACVSQPGDYRIINRMLFLMKNNSCSDGIREAIARLSVAVGKGNKAWTKDIFKILKTGEWYAKECASLILRGLVSPEREDIVTTLCQCASEEDSEELRKASISAIKLCLNPNNTEYKCLLQFFISAKLVTSQKETKQSVHKLIKQLLLYTTESRRWISENAINLIKYILKGKPGRQESTQANEEAISLVINKTVELLPTRKFQKYAFILVSTILELKNTTPEHFEKLIQCMCNCVKDNNFKSKALKIQAIKYITQCSAKITAQEKKKKIFHNCIITLMKPGLSDNNTKYRQAMMELIETSAARGDKLVHEKLLNMLYDEDEAPVKCSIIQTLAGVTKGTVEEPILFEYVNCLKDSSVAAVAADVLVEILLDSKIVIKDELLLKIAKEILVLLSSRIPLIRQCAAHVCCGLLQKKNECLDHHIQQITKRLEQLLLDDVKEVRNAALEALEQIKEWGDLNLMMNLIEHVEDNFASILRHIREKRKKDQKSYFSAELYRKLLKINAVEGDFILMELAGLQ